MMRRGLGILALVLACGGDDGTAVDDGTDTDVLTGTTGSSAESSEESEGGCQFNGDIECDGECVNMYADPDHCGGCDMPCEAGEACMDGACAPESNCPDGQAQCGGECFDLQTDAAHCGDCDVACSADATCEAGECSCPDGALACATACADAMTDEQHCGGCDQPCDAGQPCVAGSCVTATIHHILITGQSLSEGATSNVVSTEQPYDNIMFVTGVRAGGTGLDSFVPLVETQSGSGGETIASGSANFLHELIEPDGLAMRVLASAHGVGGQPYSALMKGTAPYANGMAQVAAGASLSTAMGESSAVRGVAVIHGETDHLNNNAVYDENLLQWQLDYETDVQAATAQTLPVPMFYCQMSSFTQYGQATSAIPLLELAARDARPDKMYVIGPKYFLPYTDGVHLTGDGERWLGQYYAKAFRRVLVDGQAWLPVRPNMVTREGAVITLVFDVPEPPLVLDETLVTNPGNFGFVYADDSGAAPTIASVELVDDVTVAVTLSADPVGPNGRIRYALDGIAGQPAGPMTGARGNLRDSDPAVSPFGYALFNWSVHFEVVVP